MAHIMEQGNVPCSSCDKLGSSQTNCDYCLRYEYAFTGKWITIPSWRDDPQRKFDERVMTIYTLSGKNLGTFNLPNPTHSAATVKPFIIIAQLNGPAISVETRYQLIKQNALGCQNGRFGSTL